MSVLSSSSRPIMALRACSPVANSRTLRQAATGGKPVSTCKKSGLERASWSGEVRPC